VDVENKIRPLDELARAVAALKAQGRRVVLCHGVFDLLHIGHIRYFRQARSHGDALVVTLTPDVHVDKGPFRPAFPERLRLEAVASLDVVDFAALNQWPTAEELLRLVRPDVYVKGKEFEGIEQDPTGKMAREAAIARELGIELAFAGDIVFSSSRLLNEHLSNLPREMDDFVRVFRKRHSLAEVEDLLGAMARMKVLVLGDAILDEYQYCVALGKSSKDPVLAVKERSSELFAGGALAVANHAAQFAGEVHLATFLGGEPEVGAFLAQAMDPAVRCHYFVREGSVTTLKRRFVEEYTLNKLFEVYRHDQGPSPEAEARALEWLRDSLADYDLVVASDFGHGAINQAMLTLLEQSDAYLSANTQSNAGNRGYHTISRFRRVDCVFLNESELRLDRRDETSDLQGLMEAVREALAVKLLVVTRGRYGCVTLGPEGFTSMPAFTGSTVDRVGAGDAFLSVASLAARLGAPGEMTGFLGNCVGALSVGVVGNRKAIDAMALRKFVTALMK